MVDFPDPQAVEEQLIEQLPLAVLFSHGCSPRAHQFHQQLAPTFAAAGLRLLRDPFKVGDDVQVAMRRLQIHGVIFHVTPKALTSNPVATELKTAQRIGAPILCVPDQAPVPEALRDRIFRAIPESGCVPPGFTEELAAATRQRVRLHWVLQWLMDTGRAVEEREGGVNWLLRQPPQVLAEFIGPISRLHRLAQEDPTVSSRLAAVLERTGLRGEARSHLQSWWHAVEHPLSRITIEDILSSWGFQGHYRSKRNQLSGKEQVP